MGKIGLNGTWMYKKVYVPVAPGTVMPADQKRFGLGKTTAREMATLMSRIARCELGEAGAAPLAGDIAICQVGWKMLQTQFYRTAIPRYLDGLPGATGDSIANKTGSLDAMRNDVAAISTPTGMVIVSAFTFNNKDHSWTQDQEAELTIAKMARAIVQEWSPQGLAAWPGAPKAPTAK
jgi:beta-lactamase class A